MRSTASITTSFATRSTRACSSARARSCTSSFVRWLDRANADNDRGLAYEEILGYHLEQAHRYLSELGPLDDEAVAIGADAARRLSNAANRALARRSARRSRPVQAVRGAAADEDPLRAEILPKWARP